MAYDVFTTTGINNLVNNYKTNEVNKRIQPLTTRKTRYENLNTAYSTLSSKLDSLKSILADLKANDTTSIFTSKTAASSNSNFLTAASTNGAIDGSHTIKVDQLAKNDLVLSQDLTSSTASSVITVAGTHQFTIKAGDGTGGEFVSKVSVTFETADFTAGSISNQKVMEKIQNAINGDKAIITSSSVTGSTLSSGSFNLNLNGTVTAINYSAGTYSSVIDSLVTQINQLSGVTAEKIVNGSDYQLKITVTDTSKYITIDGDTGTLLTELSVSAAKEKGSAGLVTASVFSPASSMSQLSLTSKMSGYDYRILDLSDNGGGNNALSSAGLNLGVTRTGYVQNVGTDTPGYVYATTDLNSKFQFNGVNIERNSNSFSDLISGTTVTLKSVMQATDPLVNLTVNTDVSTIKSKIQDFITKFNDIYTYIKENSKSSTTSRGMFIGDSTASTLISLFSTIAYSSVSGITSTDINSLSEIGITFNIDTGLVLSDSARLEDAIKNSNDQVQALFNSTNGVAATLYDRIVLYLGTGGYIAKSKSTFDTTISSLSDSINSQQKQIDKAAETLRNQYQKMQTQLAQLLSNQGLFNFGNNSFF